MARDRPLIPAMNGGCVSPLAMARVDLQRMRLTAEEFHNCFPRVIGPLTFRPGLRYDAQVSGDAVARNIPFIFSADDTALLQLTDEALNVVVDGDLVTRPSVSTTIANGDFNTTGSWTLVNADIDTTVANALMMQATVRGTTASAIQTITVSAVDENVEHGLLVIVTRGKPRLKLGTTSGGQDIIREQELLPGTHSIAFTPGALTIYLSLSTQSETQVVVDEVSIDAAGTLELPTPWAVADLFNLRYEQSGDVIFVTHQDYQTRRIERRGTRSWSVTEYLFRNGPWRGKTAEVTLEPSVRLGNGTLTASAAFFTEDHVGALFELTHTQTVCDVHLAGNDVYTDWVRVSGKSDGTSRQVTRAVAGTWSGTVTSQIADDKDGPWMNRNVLTSNDAATSFTAGSDNQITYARYGFQAGDYTSGTAEISLSTPGGGGVGIVRVTGYVSATVVNIEVVERLHYSEATADWQEGKYSNMRGWPASVGLFEGRLWFGGDDQIAGSVSDDFTNFSVDEEGDSGPIIRSIANGPVNKVQWILGLSRLLIGTSGAEPVARSSSFDEPMSPANFSIKDASTYGSADIQAVKLDKSAVFVHRNGKRAFKCSYSVEAQDYATQELTRYNPTILDAGVKIMAVQRMPDTRLWFVLNDGTAVCLTIDEIEDVLAWHTFETDGEIEDVCVTPNTESDDVTFIIKRTINGTDRRYRETLGYDDAAQGGTANRMADSYIERTLTASRAVGGLSHLNGEDVVVWAGSSPILTDAGEPKTFTVTGGSITLDDEVTGTVTAGLPYEGRWKSTKLAYAAQSGSALTQRKKVNTVSPLLYKTHNRAVLFGQDFDRMDPIPRKINGVDQGLNTLLETYDTDATALPGHWSTDSRLCIKFRAPLPATVMGVVIQVESHERG